MQALRILALAAGFLISLSSTAADELTADAIDRWIQSMDAVQEWAASNDIADRKLAVGENNMPDFVSALDKLGDERQGLERIAKENGFAGARSWARTANRVARAFMAVQMDARGTDMAQVRKQLESRVAQIENNARLNDAQKQQMKQQMNAMLERMRAMETMTEGVPESDREAVRQRKAQLKRLFDSQKQAQTPQ